MAPMPPSCFSARTTTRKRITPHDVLRAYDVLVYFRNLCAHDERLNCARKDNGTFAAMVELMAVALPKAVVEDFRKDLEALLSKYDESLHVITAANLREGLGLGRAD